MTLDLATPEGKEILLQLVDESDVFVTNFLPPARRKLGIEPEDIMGRNPRIIYARGSAQGPVGDMAERGGFDGVTYWTRTGASLGVTPARAPGAPGHARARVRRPPVRRWPSPAASAPPSTSASAPGEGVVVDVSLMSMGLWAMGMTISGTSVLDADALPHQYHRNSTNPLVNEYRTKDDDFIALAFLQSDRYWPEFCVLVDRARLARRRALRRVGRPGRAQRGARRPARRAVPRARPRRVAGAARPSRTASGTSCSRPVRCSHDEQALANGYVQRRRARRRRQDRPRRRPRPVRRRGAEARQGPGVRRRHRRRAPGPRPRRRRPSPISAAEA